ncbi:MAG: hypothetical protein EOO54_10940 [Haliea sp.]|nr:MAG: hypothetical protein EOO54_10940 [Haliea sp.]
MNTSSTARRTAACLAALIFSAAMMAPARAQADASAVSMLSALPVASVVVAGAAASGAVASSVLAVPVALSVGGAVLVVKAVESTARGTVYRLERASDGAQASIEIVGRTAAGASLVVGGAVVVSVIGAGVVLSAAGEAIAFLPNALGRALMHNERLT